MTADDVAAFLQVPLATLYNWRSEHKGPPAFRVGKYLRYRRQAVEAWLENQAD
jgi:excisionase family DNA binding protein